jgi:hypothetical protein
MEVDANTTRPRRQNEDLLLTFGILKVIDTEVTLVRRRLPVNATVPIAPNTKHVVEDIHELGHLAENQYFAILSNQLRDQVVEDFEFH